MQGRVSDGQGREEGASSSWGLAADVFQQRYQAAVTHTEGAWQPLPRITLQLEPAASNAGSVTCARLAASAVPGSRAAQPARPATSAAAAPQLEPWLLAAGAYAEAGAWQQAARSSRARMLFQYKPYSKQEPLNASEAEVVAVIEAVFGKMGSGPSAFQEAADTLWGSLSGAQFGLVGAASTGEVAAVILVKLVMDLYVAAGARAAFPLTLMLLQRPLLLGETAAQARVFDVLYNLSIHGQLLHDAAAEAVPEDAQALADAVAELDAAGDHVAASANWKATVTSAFRATLAATMKAAAVHPPANPRSSLEGRGSKGSVDRHSNRGSVDGRSQHGAAATAAEWPPLLGARPPARCAAAERFQQWLRLLLFQLLGALAASGAASEAAWVAALSCLVHLSTYSGSVVRAYIEELPLSVVAALMEQCRQHLWSEQLHAWLITLAANLLYVQSDSDERGMQRSMKAASVADSTRSGGKASSVGGSHSVSGGGSCSNPAWWTGSQLDHNRLAAFGGMRQVLQCYREAPTAEARRSMFAVLYDYVVSGQKPSSRDAWAPVLLQHAHSSEALALGAALLRMNAAEALHPLFLAGVSGSMQPLADAVSMQMAALQSANPGRVVSVPGALVSECLECLEEIATSGTQVPIALQDAVKHTIEAVTSPEAASPAFIAADAAAMWGCLADCMRDHSELGSRAGRGWLLQLLVAAAEHELARSCSPQPEQQQQQDEGAADLPQQQGQQPPPALLPEVAGHGGCQLQPGRRGMRGQEALRELLIRALATTPDSQAADCFMDAVGSLLAHVRLRCAAANHEAEDGCTAGAGHYSSNGTLVGTSSAPGGGGGTLLPTAAAGTPGSGLRQAGSASRLAAAATQPLSSGGPQRQLARRLSQAGTSRDSLAEVDTSAVRADQSDDASLKSADSSPFDLTSGGWRTLNCAEAVISTLSLAVEWLLQAPQEARQAAMLHATQLLLAFTLTPPSQPRSGSSSSSGAAQASNGQQGPGTPVVSPGPSRPGTQHRLAIQTPAPLQLPASSGSSPAVAGGMLSPGGLPQRPVSPNLAALQAAAAAATTGKQDQGPVTPRVASLDRMQGAGEAAAVTAADVMGSVSRAAVGEGGSAADQLEQAGAAGEAGATMLWSFLNGMGMVPQELLRLMPPLLLRTLFEDLRPDSTNLQYDALSAAGAGASAARLTRAADEALGVKAAVQSDRPLWDARAAVLLLLMGRCAHDAAALRALGGAAFFTALLGEPDVRVRHYAAVFVLRQLMLQQPLQYRRALRGVVARAQSANDEKLLANPYLQLRAMLDQGSVHLDQL